MSQKEIDILKRALVREKQARKSAEKILEEKSRVLYETSLKLEQLLEEKSSQLQGVFENIIDAYVVIDLYGNVLKFNEAATSLFGYDIIKHPINVVELIYKDDYSYAMRSFAKLKDKGFFKNYQARVITKNRKVRWVQINASIVFDKNKKPIAAQGIVRDITNIKKNRELINEQKTQLDAIVQNSSIGIVLTQNGRILTTNESIQKTLGYEKHEFEKLTVKDITFKDDYYKSDKYMAKMDSGESQNFVLHKRYVRKNGSILWAKTNVSSVNDGEGKVKYQVALIEDITKEREKSLVVEMINNITKAILGKIDINEIALEITNNIAEYLDSQDCVIYLVDTRRNILEKIAAYKDNAESKNNISINKVIPIGDGIVGSVARSGIAEIVNDTSKDKRYIVDDKIRFSEITVPIISEGKVIGVIDSEHTSKYYFTNEHLHTLKNIASLVAVQLKSAIYLRERNIAETKNKELLVELEKSNEELHEYAHIVSHDLKSPLRSINALTNWIKEDNKDHFNETTKENFDLLDTTIEKMELLISDILSYSSLGSKSIEKTKIDLNSVIYDLEQILYIPDNISIKVLKKLPMVYGERAKYQQLFQNLLSNAIKFNDKKKGIIEIDYKEMKSFYEFSVKDNGIGISEEHHTKIFKIFHSLKSSKDSTGIGLSIVKKIVDLLKGEIRVDSEIGKGTTFYFTIKKRKR